MVSALNKNTFWDRVEREMRMQHPTLSRFSARALHLGVVMVLLTAAYMVSLEFRFLDDMPIHPIYGGLTGLVLIFSGAFLRFRLMGPIIEGLRSRS